MDRSDMTDVLVASGQRPQKQEAQLSVLVVDPVPESRSLLKGALRSVPGVGSVRDTGMPKSIMEILQEQAADVIFMEQRLSEEEEAFEFVKLIKNHPAGANAKFVLTSNDLDMESRRKGMEAGVLGYLAKPFDIRGLEAAIRDAMGRVSTNHKDTLDKVRRISFFAEFSDAELVRLLKICHTRKFTKDEVIFSEGESGDRFYVVLVGSVEITKQRKDRVETLMTVKAGECFGEMAIVDAEPRSADARALSENTLIEVNAEIIKNANDVLSLKIYRKLAILVTQKLRSYTQHLEDGE